MRWLRELLDPKLKCARLGHVPETVIRSGMMTPHKAKEVSGHTPYRAVAVSFTESWTECRRCCELLRPNAFQVGSSINSLEMPEEMWQKLDRNGLLYD